MKEIKGDLFEQDCDAICITTNGYIKKDGSCAMGAGCAWEAKERWKGMDHILGELLSKYGNHVHIMGAELPYTVLSFPVKKVYWEFADIDLIQRSCEEVVQIANENNWSKIIIPRPGCGNGGLKWEEVKPEIEPLLDDRFYIITNE
ncbi:MAG: hypothetical protein R3321_10015 [Nitrososphaeraceae archaeon]|nr:hypothetical protein [Nitrososphaeraceae archaeon]